MLRHIFKIFLFSILVSIGFSGCSKKAGDSARQNEVVVYTYDSFCGEWGSWSGNC